jgi:hypothetical protein
MNKGLFNMNKGIFDSRGNAFLKCFFALILSVSFQSMADEPWKFRSQGYEINLYYQGNIKQPKVIGFDAGCQNSSCNGRLRLDRLVEDFVSALKNKSIYRYKWVVTCPTGACDDIREVPIEALEGHINEALLLPNEPIYTSGGSRLTRTTERSRDFGQVTFESAAAATGSGLVTAIAEHFRTKSGQSDGSSVNTPALLQVHTDSRGRPISMCKITKYECKKIEEVTMTNFDNGEIGVSTPAAYSGANGAMMLAIDAFLYEYFLQRQYKCRETFVVIGKIWYRQRVCWQSLP